jgi:hypothetical protein
LIKILQLLLSVVFFVFIMPVSIIFRLLGKDPLRLRAFKEEQDSVFIEKNHTFIGEDLQKPF